MEGPQEAVDNAKEALKNNTDAIALAQQTMAGSQEGEQAYESAKADLEQLEPQTQGLRDTLEAAEAKLTPFLIDQGRDNQYVAEGLEFTAWTNLQLAKEAGETARAAVDENKDEEKALARELKDAKWALDNAKSQDEYVHAREVYEDVKGRSDRLGETLSEARKTLEELEGVVGDLEQEYNSKKEEREGYAKFLRDNNLDVEEYDPKEGPPREPKESITSNLMRV